MIKRGAAKTHISTQRNALDDLIETERRRLSRAEAVLVCLSAALEQSDAPEATTFSDVAEVVSTLIAETVDRLDSVNRRRVPLAGKKKE